MTLEGAESTVEIRCMRPEDYDAVYALWLKCAGMGLNSVDDSREGICRYLTRNPGTCFVAEAEGRVVGAILSGHDGRRGYISHTAVAPDTRGQGVGRRLVQAALDALGAEGISKVALVAFARNAAGNAFWARMGFGVREDLIYRDRALRDMERIDT